MSSAAARRISLAGAVVAASGLVLFVTIHSLLISPIWGRAARGIPFALIAGVGLAGAFDRIGSLRGWQSPGDGVRFGAAMFLSLVPETIFSNALRLAGLHANDWPGSLGSIALAAASGALTGWWLTRDRSALRPFAIATLALVIGMAGPIPIVNGAPAAWLFLSFLPILIVGGLVLAGVHHLVAPQGAA
jgi:hypothetical protein